MNSFKQFLIDNYSREELEDIYHHGCANCAPSGMIYYSETAALYDKYAEELHDIVGNYADEFGEMPKYIVDNLGHEGLFKNAMIWFCAELLALELSEQLEA